MPVLSLYETCLRKMAINLREGIYKSCHENLFSYMPSQIVNDIIPRVLAQQSNNGLRVEDLEQLLTSGKVRELKISDFGRIRFIQQLETMSKILHFLTSGCKELKILHLPVLDVLMDWLKSRVSKARTRSEVYAAALSSGISAALENLFRNTPNLEDLHCSFRFDLKALRNCRKLRRLSLHFHPQQHWHEFLEREEDRFQTHDCLEFFTVCVVNEFAHDSTPIPIPYDDVAIILRHCPGLTSLGFVESSGALSQLSKPFESPLRHCFWRDVEYDLVENASQPLDHVLHRVEEAVKNSAMIKELDFKGCCSRSISCLKNLRNLTCLNIDLDDDVSNAAFSDALQAIGPQLKHLSFYGISSMDVSLFLQNCCNLESLGIEGKDWFANSAISLPHLERLTCHGVDENGGQIFRLLRDCNQLTDLFLQDATFFDDQTLNNFLKRNSLLNLNVAYLSNCSLTENGFREFLLNAPHLERVRIFSNDRQIRSEHYERAITATNHKALYNDHKDPFLEDIEFFQNRWTSYTCWKD